MESVCPTRRGHETVALLARSAKIVAHRDFSTLVVMSGFPKPGHNSQLGDAADLVDDRL